MRLMSSVRIGRLSAALILLATMGLWNFPSAAAGPEVFLATLDAIERHQMENWLAARAVHDHQVNAYWSSVNAKRTERKRKKGTSTPLGPDDYVMTFPPTYAGPEISASLAKRWTAFQEKEEAKAPPPKPRPGIPEFLANAKAIYDFVPERISEREFKTRYAREAIALGLTKEQVVRIYALETSGLGAADMVAGIHPIRKTGTPISTAIGYAQLLSANTVNELAKSGPKFIERLRRLPAGDPARAAQINGKIAALQKMYAVARSVPDDWGRHVALGGTPKGLGIHAINVDGDIGPWLQVLKLKGLKIMAEKKGVSRLSGAEIELMNLAGPGTGLEMMQPAGRAAPTPNFFERNAYGRNTIVRGKTSAELIAALDERMEENIKNAGAVEFAQVFDELGGGAAAIPAAPAPAPARAAREDVGVPQPFGSH